MIWYREVLSILTAFVSFESLSLFPVVFVTEAAHRFLSFLLPTQVKQVFNESNATVDTWRGQLATGMLKEIIDTTIEANQIPSTIGDQ